MAWTTPRTWVANEVVTAALMNAHLRDNLSVIATAGITGWESYTPTWTASGTAPAIGNGTQSGYYCQIGKLVVCYWKVVAGSTTTFGTGTYYWAPPATFDTNLSARMGVGTFVILDTGTTEWPGTIKIESSTNFSAIVDDTSGRYVAQTVPMTWANGDGIFASATVEAA